MRVQLTSSHGHVPVLRLLEVLGVGTTRVGPHVRDTLGVEVTLILLIRYNILFPPFKNVYTNSWG